MDARKDGMRRVYTAALQDEQGSRDRDEMRRVYHHLSCVCLSDRMVIQSSFFLPLIVRYVSIKI